MEAAQEKGAGDLKSALASAVETQSLECAQLDSGLVLVQGFLLVLPCLPFGIVMHIPGCYMLQVCDLLLFDFIGYYS